ncbi:MAG: nickel-dependent hydrogenase large subunit, partial [Thermomicrobiales bacterium]
MARIVIDPVTRIEGHLRVEAEVNGGQVADAWSSGTMFRGIELILRGRDPREAWIWAQRICGVCTTVHALASVRAVEDALRIEIPDNARLIRQLMASMQLVQDHVIHFYHLHALDWVDVTGALKADPAKTAQLAQSLSDYPKSSATYFKGIQDRVRALADSGQLSLFTSGYWGHPAYQLPPEADLMAVAHYIEALDWQRDVIRMHAVLGGKNPHPQTYLVGGMAASMDPNEPDATINLERIAFMRQLVTTAQAFITQVYVPDVLAIAGFYKDWFTRGEGLGNFMAYGGYPSGSINDPASFFLPRGIILNRDLTQVHPFSPDNVSEFVTHSWYEYTNGNNVGKHPFDGGGFCITPQKGALLARDAFIAHDAPRAPCPDGTPENGRQGTLH